MDKIAFPLRRRFGGGNRRFLSSLIGSGSSLVTICVFLHQWRPGRLNINVSPCSPEPYVRSSTCGQHVRIRRIIRSTVLARSASRHMHHFEICIRAGLGMVRSGDPPARKRNGGRSVLEYHFNRHPGVHPGWFDPRQQAGHEQRFLLAQLHNRADIRDVVLPIGIVRLLDNDPAIDRAPPGDSLPSTFRRRTVRTGGRRIETELAAMTAALNGQAMLSACVPERLREHGGCGQRRAERAVHHHVPRISALPE